MKFLRSFAKRVTILVLVIVIAFFMMKAIAANQYQQSPTIWQFQSVDTMKYSRDAAGDPAVLKQIPQFVADIAHMGATTIAVDTPYDERFYPVLSAWVKEARKDGLHIWFRGNFSGWEGWFDTPQFTDPSVHHKMTMNFITSHPELFQDGDIFTPVPEPENGALGDPRGSDQKSAAYNQFLIASYNNCIAAFKKIDKQVTCGYFSMNGDIAKQILTPETVAQIGNIVVIDHYVDSSEQMASDIDYLHNKFPQAKLVLGEFGAPIDDINGPMNEDEQANFVNSLLQVFYQKRIAIQGINYWVLAGGSTSLLNPDNSPRKVVRTLSNFYEPPVVTGEVKDDVDKPIAGATVITSDTGYTTKTDTNGYYQFAIISKQHVQITVSHEGYTTASFIVTGSSEQKITKNIILTSKKKNMIQSIIAYIKNLLSH